MLRREVDGVAWHCARQAMFGKSEPVPVVQLFWTTGGTIEQACDAFWRSVESLEAGMEASGASLTRHEVAVRAGSGRRSGLTGRAELAEVLRGLCEDRGDEQTTQFVSVHAGWDRLTLEMCELGPGPAPWTAQVRSERFPDGGLVDALGEMCGQLLVDLARCGLVTWGSVTRDHGGLGRTPYEAYFPVPPAEAAREAARHPRGYYWLNLLTAGHIEALGGAAAIVEFCRRNGLEATPIEGGSGTRAMIVRAEECLSEFSDESFGAVHRLLDPILTHKPYGWYAGWPLRIIKEPGTAFRIVDPTVHALTPVFDDDPAPGEDDW